MPTADPEIDMMYISFAISRKDDRNIPLDLFVVQAHKTSVIGCNESE